MGCGIWREGNGWEGFSTKCWERTWALKTVHKIITLPTTSYAGCSGIIQMIEGLPLTNRDSSETPASCKACIELQRHALASWRPT